MQSPLCPVPEVTEKGSHKGRALKKPIPVRGTMMGSMIELRPTASQAQYLSKCAGVMRFTYNALVAKWKSGEKYNAKAFQKHCSTLRQATPFMQEVSSRATYVAADNFRIAAGNFFKSCRGTRKGRGLRPPKFKKKGKSPDVFRLDHHSQFSVQGRTLRVQGLPEKIRMRENIRFAGTVHSASIKRRAGKWFASFLVELAKAPPATADTQKPSVGIDLGLKVLAALSTGELVKNPRPLRQKLRLLKRRQRQQSRRHVRGARKQSNRYQKASAQVARLHLKVADCRADAQHKFTAGLVRRFSRIVIEDLAVGNMVKNRRLSRAIADAGWATIRQQITYKCKIAGVELVVVPRFFASSQTCSKCNHRLPVSLKLSDRTFSCPSCGLVADRDLNAALNLERYHETTVVAPVTGRRKTYALDLRKSFPQGKAGLPEGVNIGSTLTGGVSAKQPVMVADGGD